MAKLQFFPGERLVENFALRLSNGDVDLRCTVVEKWVEKLARSVSCGRSRKFILKKTLGISLTERKELEAAISSSLGKGIAELKSEIRSKSGLEISFEETHEEQEEFSIQAPKCGRTTLQVYQLLRLYNFSYRDNRSFLKRWFSSLRKFPREMEEWLNRIYDMSMTDDTDPDCLIMYPECQGASEGREGLVNLDFENFGLLASYRRGDDGIVLINLNVSVPAKNIEELMYSEVTFERRMIPPHLLFLSGEHKDKLSARVLPYQGELAKARQIRTRGIHERRMSSESIQSEIPSYIMSGLIGATIILLLTTESGREILRSTLNIISESITPTHVATTEYEGRAARGVSASAESASEAEPRATSAGGVAKQDTAGA
ncbi:MAG TPA: hypothetical protein VN256_23045 [Pyrinomonadaceae bacterium]|nr:hypothetical protein [Pyrinomonadaceae bacterium]